MVETWETKSGRRQKRKGETVEESSSTVSPSFAAVVASKINPITAGVVDARKGIRWVMIRHLTTSTIKASKKLILPKTVSATMTCTSLLLIQFSAGRQQYCVQYC